MLFNSASGSHGSGIYRVLMAMTLYGHNHQVNCDSSIAEVAALMTSLGGYSCSHFSSIGPHYGCLKYLHREGDHEHLGQPEHAREGLTVSENQLRGEGT